MKHYRLVAALAAIVCLWVGSSSAFAADLVWQTDKARAISMAKAQGKKILLLAGRDELVREPGVPGCAKTTFMKHTICETSPVKGLIEQNFIPWYVDVDWIDANVGYYANYAGYAVYNLPLICVIDPYDSEHYLDRTTDATPAVIDGFYTRLLQYAPCTYAISPTSAPLGPLVHTDTVAVTTAGTCSWSATSNAPSWITITSGSAGTGNGTVAYSVSANSTTSSRTGTMTIAGQTFTITQGGNCTYAISPGSAFLGTLGNTGTVDITTSGSCSWSAVSNDPSWLTITGRNSGTGNSTVAYSVTANTTGSSRTGTMTIAGQTFTMTQDGSCTYAISPSSASLGTSGDAGTVAVTTSSTCAWNAASNAPSWITITAGSTGTGNGTVAYSVAANTTGSGRTGTMTIGGETFTVNQAGFTPCTFTIFPSFSDGFLSMSDAGFVNVTTSSSGCSWSAASNDPWITVTSGSSGSGDGTVGYSVASNSGLSRTGTITIGGQTFTINQTSANDKFYLDTVQRIFIGYYQRPADPGGLIYYAGILAGNGGNIGEFLESFANSAESQGLYGTINSSNIATFIHDVYNNLFAHDADPAWSEYYVNGFNSGQFTAASIMFEVFNNAQNEDLQAVKNKLSAANLFTTTVDPDLDGSNVQATFAGIGDAIAARNFLAFVTSNPTTIPTQSQTTEYIRVNIADPGDPILAP